MNTKVTMQKIGLALAVIAVVGVIVSFRLLTQDNRSCTPVLPIEQSKTMIDALDKQATMFASTTVELSGRSAEGGMQRTYTNGNAKKIVEQRFYGETGRSYLRFYFEGKKIFAIVKLNVEYAVPISVDKSGTVKATEEKDYYLDVNGKVCSADANSVTQSVDNDTQDMIQEYIRGIQ